MQVVLVITSHPLSQSHIHYSHNLPINPSHRILPESDRDMDSRWASEHVSLQIALLGRAVGTVGTRKGLLPRVLPEMLEVVGSDGGVVRAVRTRQDPLMPSRPWRHHPALSAWAAVHLGKDFARVNMGNRYLLTSCQYA